jgi:MinD-like ATPase involved in chromosome partitioning or flagellar assembly
MYQEDQGQWSSSPPPAGVDEDTQQIPAAELASVGAGASGGSGAGDGAELARRLAELRGSPTTNGSVGREAAPGPARDAAGTGYAARADGAAGTNKAAGSNGHGQPTEARQNASPASFAGTGAPPTHSAPPQQQAASSASAPQAPAPAPQAASSPAPAAQPASPSRPAPAAGEAQPGVRQTSPPFGQAPTAAAPEAQAEPKPPGRIPTERMLLGSPETAPDSPGWRFIYRLTGRKVNRESAAMRELHVLQDRIGQSLRSGPYVIAVGGYKGGAGKSTAAINTGIGLATYRSDKVLVIEGNSDVGTLSSRTSAICPVSVREVARAARNGDIQNSGQMASMVGRDPSRLDVIGSEDEDPVSVAELTEAELGELLALAGRFYDIVLIDMGINQTHPATRAARRWADAFVLATGAGVAEAKLVSQALSGLWSQQHDLVARAVLALTEPAKPAVDVSVIENHFSQAGVPTVRIPQDPHLATDGPVSWGQLAQPTRMAVTRLSAEVVDKLAGVTR